MLVHGFHDISAGWRNQIPVLLDAGYRVIAPDCIGYGGTVRPVLPLLHNRASGIDSSGVAEVYDWANCLVRVQHRNSVAERSISTDMRFQSAKSLSPNLVTLPFHFVLSMSPYPATLMLLGLVSYNPLPLLISTAALSLLANMLLPSGCASRATRVDPQLHVQALR